MANWTLFVFDIYQDCEKLGITKDVVSETLEVDISDVCNHNNEHWTFSGEAKWGTNFEHIENFAKEYNLTCCFQEAEPGGDFYFKVTFENGIEEENINASYFSEESIDFHGVDYFFNNLFYGDQFNDEIYDILCKKGHIDQDKKKEIAEKILKG